MDVLKTYKLPGTDQIWHNLSKQVVIHYILKSTEHINSIWNNEELPK
jgi:hypothetical protein